VGFFSVTIIAHPRPAAICTPMLSIYNIGKAVGSFNGTNDDIATIAAITAIGATLGNVFFPPETNASGTTITTLDIN
jgi:hypothetical protein